MIYYFKKGKPNRPVLMLLHGTGGNEFDLVSIANLIDPDASILSFRGDVNENGNLRFFNRFANGVFDVEDLKTRTDSLYNLIGELSKELEFNIEDVIALGYSNGANMIGSILISKQVCFKAAILMHPMVARRDISPSNLSNTKLLITAGFNDPISPVRETQLLIDILIKGNADVSVKFFDQGHRISEEEVEAVTEWYKKIV